MTTEFMPRPRRISKPGFVALAVCAAAAAAIYLVDKSQGFAGARLVESLIALVALAVVTWAVPAKARNALVVACSLIFGFAVLEGSFLVISAISGKSAHGVVTDDEGLGSLKPIVGWGPPHPGVFHAWKKVDGKVVYDTHVTIDAALNRKTVPSEGAGAIAFFGDSWTFGDGVEDDGTIPQAFADITQRKIPVLNLSFKGWSPAVNLIALQHQTYTSLLHAPRHFILFSAMFHLERTGCRGDFATSHAPRYILEGDELKLTGTCAEAEGILAPVKRFFRKFELYNRFAPKLATPDRKDVETYIKVIETFAATAERLYGVKTTLLFAPFADAYIKGTGYTEEAVIAALRKAGVDVLVDTLPPVDDEALYQIPNDGHPTALSNKARAREILDHLRKVDPVALAALDSRSN